MGLRAALTPRVTANFFELTFRPSSGVNVRYRLSKVPLSDSTIAVVSSDEPSLTTITSKPGVYSCPSRSGSRRARVSPSLNERTTTDTGMPQLVGLLSPGFSASITFCGSIPASMVSRRTARATRRAIPP